MSSEQPVVRWSELTLEQRRWHATAAHFAALAYPLSRTEPHACDTNLPPGWVEIARQHCASTEFFAAFLQHDEQRRRVFTVRGTVPSRGNLHADANLALGVPPRMAALLAKFIREHTCDLTSDDVAPWTVSLVGHSLGATLAEMVATASPELDMSLHDVFDKVHERAVWECITFDSPGLPTRKSFCAVDEPVPRLVTFLAAPNVVNTCAPHHPRALRFRVVYPKEMLLGTAEQLAEIEEHEEGDEQVEEVEEAVAAPPKRKGWSWLDVGMAVAAAATVVAGVAKLVNKSRQRNKQPSKPKKDLEEGADEDDDHEDEDEEDPALADQPDAYDKIMMLSVGALATGAAVKAGSVAYRTLRDLQGWTLAQHSIANMMTCLQRAVEEDLNMVRTVIKWPLFLQLSHLKPVLHAAISAKDMAYDEIEAAIEELCIFA